MSEFYARDGEPLTLEEWAAIHDMDWEEFVAYKRVAETTVGPYLVSTVWLGFNHNPFGGAPLIFETMVFPSDGGSLLDFDCVRYSTEEQALAGHEEMVTLVRATTMDVKDMDVTDPVEWET